LSAGAYALAGQSITDLRSRADNLAPGAYVYTGQTVTDVKTGAVVYADSLNPGAYLIAGQDLADALVQTPTRRGGDDAFRNPGWSKQAWKKKSQREEAIEDTIEATYQRIMGIVPAPAVVAEIKREAKVEIPRIDYTQETKFIEWLSAEIADIKAIQQELDDDDEEAMMLLMG
jgi:hypothetical protein